MTSTSQCLAILESLHFPAIIVEPGNVNTTKLERIKLNLQTIIDAIRLSPGQVTENFIQDLKLDNFISAKTSISHNDTEYIYTLYLLRILLVIFNDADFSSTKKEDLISVTQKSVVISGIEDIIEYGLKQNLHDSLYNERISVFSRCPSFKSNMNRTELIVAAFSPLVFVQSLYTPQTIQNITLYYMAAVNSLFFACEADEHQMEQSRIRSLQINLQKIWTSVSKTIYYRNLMVIYAILPYEHKKRVHKDMLLKLWSPGGFKALLFATRESGKSEGKPLPQVICRIVAQTTFPIKAQQSLVKQILQFIAACPSNEDLMTNIGVCLLSLKELCKNRSENKDIVQSWLRQQMGQLVTYDMENLTVMKWQVFEELIVILFQMFCTSTIECLPSELLLPYLPILVSCHMQIRLCGQKDQVCSHISSLILNIINNRQKDELESILKSFALNSYPNSWLHLNHNITFEENPLCVQELRIVQKPDCPNVFCTRNMFALIAIINESSFSIMCFQVFMALFRLLPTIDIDARTIEGFANECPLLAEEELEDNAISEKLRIYEIKMDLIKSLELLLNHKNLNALIIENISEVLIVLKDILIAYSQPSNQSDKEIDCPELMILLVLIGEIAEGCSSPKLEEVRRALLAPLKRLQKKAKTDNIRHRITFLEKQILGETSHVHSKGTFENEFVEARFLIESAESYQHVHGIEKLIKMTNAKREIVLSNVHVITTLALNTLRSSESYSFLNCVRLFVALVNVNAPEVLEILVDEYLNELGNIDFRLVVGETLLKVCNQLGPLCYNYKALLLNCYISGCRSPLDEFRFSSYSNLAQMCRLLSYQVQSFFAELLNLIDSELTSGKYLPAQRAAVMVLNNLLDGMNNLYDYEEMLLPIYRLLKYLALSENADEKIRLHATNGLEILSDKCKQLLATTIQRPLAKKIEIMNTGSNYKRKLKDHILYME